MDGVWMEMMEMGWECFDCSQNCCLSFLSCLCFFFSFLARLYYIMHALEYAQYLVLGLCRPVQRLANASIYFYLQMSLTRQHVNSTIKPGLWI